MICFFNMKSSNANTYYDNLTKSIGLEITAKPNPADTWVVFTYHLPYNTPSAMITISDVQGQIIDVIHVRGIQGQKVWDIRHIKSGVYIYKLKAGNISQNGKLIIK